MAKRGKFITIEGIEGVGKTTNMAFIEQWLKDRSIRYITTREPGGTPLAESIRDLLLSPRDETVDPTAELLMVFAARAQHLNQLIQPALERGEWVLCDRFTDATYAYQGGGRGLDTDLIGKLENLVQGSLRPDFTLLLDIDVEQGLARAGKRGALDRFESETLAFFDRVRASYLDRAASDAQRFGVVDAAQPLEQVQEQIEITLKRLEAGN